VLYGATQAVCDFLVITQILQGPFIYDGPYGYEEVLEEDRRPIPGVLEEEVKAQLVVASMHWSSSS